MALGVLLAGAAMMAAPVQAEVRSGTSDGAGVLAASFDDAAASLTLTVAAGAGEFRGQMKTYCSEYPKPVDSPGEEIPVDLVLTASEATSSGGELGQAIASSAVIGGQATLVAGVFKDREYRCLEGTVGGTAMLLYFAGYRHETLTAAGAASAVRADLVAKYGTATAGKPTYLACPAKRVSETALCRYQLGRGGLVRVGTYTVDEGETALGATRVRALTYNQRPVRCASKYQRDEQLDTRVVTGKKLVAPRVLCGSDLVRFLVSRSLARFPRPLSTVVFKQTPAAGFEPLSRYVCAPRATANRSRVTYRWRCANSLGDRVTFRFAVRRNEARG